MSKHSTKLKEDPHKRSKRSTEDDTEKGKDKVKSRSSKAEDTERGAKSKKVEQVLPVAETQSSKTHKRKLDETQEPIPSESKAGEKSSDAFKSKKPKSGRAERGIKLVNDEQPALKKRRQSSETLVGGSGESAVAVKKRKDRSKAEDVAVGHAGRTIKTNDEERSERKKRKASSRTVVDNGVKTTATVPRSSDALQSTISGIGHVERDTQDAASDDLPVEANTKRKRDPLHKVDLKAKADARKADRKSRKKLMRVTPAAVPIEDGKVEMGATSENVDDFDPAAAPVPTIKTLDQPMKPVDELAGEEKKKRKRQQTDANELEVDVSRPEPPSKKSLRKSKKQTSLKATGSTEDKRTSSRDPTSTEHIEETTPESPPQTVKYSIWIGNLPWAATKATLVDWFKTNSAMTVDSITRVHMPPPSKAQATRTSLKPQNKGFAYVDFATEDDHAAALALSETRWNNRPVLIKDAKDYQGRPEQDISKITSSEVISKKPKGRRICVKNLDYAVTEEDLRTHFQPCGVIEKLQIATFEDSGKCRGFGFLLFETDEAAEAAVRGWIKLPADKLPVKLETPSAADAKDPTTKVRKWFVNRMRGREIHCEFAEDATTRYEKRFGKAKVPSKGRSTGHAADGNTRTVALEHEPDGVESHEQLEDKFNNGYPHQLLEETLTPDAGVITQDTYLTPSGHVKEPTQMVMRSSQSGDTAQVIAPLVDAEIAEGGSVSLPLSATERERPKASPSVANRIIKRFVTASNDETARQARAKAKLDALNAQIGKRNGMMVEAKGVKVTFDE
ncbi:MAG: hypothetical protein M1828_000790 [Chrysothrix sp. TS-e1954]|nr:MAG: hypothetical protein M1828_000790 [Chrysothrix sp. TS-e1954]